MEELRKVTTHPSAGELCDMIRQRLPRIGMATVYRNLELLSECCSYKIQGHHLGFSGICPDCNAEGSTFINFKPLYLFPVGVIKW